MNTPSEKRAADEVAKMVNDNPLASEEEKLKIHRALDAGRSYGYGNIMAWLATEWAMMLREKWGHSDEAAIAAASNRGPYPLPPRKEHSNDQTD